MKHHAWPRASLRKLQLMVSGHFPTQTWLQSVGYAKNEDLQWRLPYFSCQGQKRGGISYDLEAS